jgi:hypothetical protein
MPIVALALAAVAAGAILMIFMAITGGSSEQRVQARLNQFGAGQVQTLEEIELQEPFLERSVLPILRRLSGSANRRRQRNVHDSDGKAAGHRRSFRQHHRRRLARAQGDGCRSRGGRTGRPVRHPPRLACRSR